MASSDWSMGGFGWVYAQPGQPVSDDSNATTASATTAYPSGLGEAAAPRRITQMANNTKGTDMAEENAKSGPMIEVSELIGMGWFVWRSMDDDAVTDGDIYLRDGCMWCASDPTYYPTSEEAEEAKARLEFRMAHPNMPEEWYERNEPGAKEFTLPDHVMFRGERLGTRYGFPLRTIGCWERDPSPASACVMVVANSFEVWANDNECLYTESWDSDEKDLRESHARLQAWLAKDAEEHDAERLFGSAPTSELMPRGKIEVINWDEMERLASEARAAETKTPMDDVCLDCEEPFDAYRRKASTNFEGHPICSNCHEWGLVGIAYSNYDGSPDPKKVYDEPPATPLKMSATAKWHNANTSVDAKPGWEE